MGRKVKHKDAADSSNSIMPNTTIAENGGGDTAATFCWLEKADISQWMIARHRNREEEVSVE